MLILNDIIFQKLEFLPPFLTLLHLSCRAKKMRESQATITTGASKTSSLKLSLSPPIGASARQTAAGKEFAECVFAHGGDSSL
jgi:hypothetical protein